MEKRLLKITLVLTLAGAALLLFVAGAYSRYYGPVRRDVIALQERRSAGR